MLFDINKLEWSHRLSELLKIPLSTQPTLLKSAGVAGKITNAASEQTGLSTSTVAVSGGGDTECSALGAGVVAEGQALVSIGTSLMVGVVRGKPTFASGGPIRELHGTGMFTSCHVIDGMWMMENGSMGGTMLSWFRREFGELEEQKARELGIGTYDFFNREASTSTPSSNSPVFVLPNSAIFNLTTEHKRSDVIRGIQEGVAYEAQQALEATEQAGIDVREITMVAGGAKSEVWRQIVADVTNRPVEAPDQVETGAYGAAILACLGAGVYAEVHNVPRAGRRFQNSPNAERHKIYELLFEKYKRMYELTKSY
jgi:xylulokinase